MEVESYCVMAVEVSLEAGRIQSKAGSLDKRGLCLPHCGAEINVPGTAGRLVPQRKGKSQQLCCP